MINLLQVRVSPIGVRLVSWFYYLAAAAGTVGGVVRMFEDLRAGHFNFAFSLGVGMSSGAIARGLRSGDSRAWRWARRLAAAAVILMLLASALLVRYPTRTTLELPWGSRQMDAGDPRVIDVALAVAAISAAQWFALSTRKARRYFERDTPKINHSNDSGILRKAL